MTTRAESPQRLLWSIVGLFVANGLLVGSWVGSFPALRGRYAISTVGISLVLVTAGVCALASMQVTGHWAERHGARRPALLGPVVMGAAMLGLAVAPGYPAALACAAVYGVGNGMMDVAMNALGVEVEQRLRRVRMGLFHGSWSLGAFAAAMLVVAYGPWSARLWPPLLTGLTLAGVAVATLGRHAPESRIVESRDGRRGALPRATWVLGIMALCFGFAEGTGHDWSALNVAAVARVAPGTAAWGLACLSAAMVTVRLLGDRIVARTGRRWAVFGSAALAAVGYLVTVLAGSLAVVLVGWLLVGAGVALIAPQIYGLAGHVGGPRMLGVVVGFGYTSFLACPALVGATANAVGLQRAMVIPLVAAVTLAGLSLAMPADPESGAVAG